MNPKEVRNLIFHPLNQMVLLKPIIREKIGRLWIPDQAKGRAMEATVLGVGPGRTTSKGVILPIDLKVGDHIYCRYYHESVVEFDGEKLMMLPEDEIIGVRVR